MPYTDKKRVISRQVFYSSLIYWPVEMAYGFLYWFDHFNQLMKFPGVTREHWLGPVLMASFAMAVGLLIIISAIDLMTADDDYHPPAVAGICIFITAGFYSGLFGKLAVFIKTVFRP